VTGMSSPSLPTRALRVVVVDDQLPFRIALRRVLQRATDVDDLG